MLTSARSASRRILVPKTGCKVADPVNPGWIWAFNDARETKHQDILYVFDLALQLVHEEMLVAA